MQVKRLLFTTASYMQQQQKTYQIIDRSALQLLFKRLIQIDFLVLFQIIWLAKHANLTVKMNKQLSFAQPYKNGILQSGRHFVQIDVELDFVIILAIGFFFIHVVARSLLFVIYIILLVLGHLNSFIYFVLRVVTRAITPAVVAAGAGAACATSRVVVRR